MLFTEDPPHRFTIEVSIRVMDGSLQDSILQGKARAPKSICEMNALLPPTHTWRMTTFSPSCWTCLSESCSMNSSKSVISQSEKHRSLALNLNSFRNTRLCTSPAQILRDTTTFGRHATGLQYLTLHHCTYSPTPGSGHVVACLH